MFVDSYEIGTYTQNPNTYIHGVNLETQMAFIPNGINSIEVIMKTIISKCYHSWSQVFPTVEDWKYT